MRRPILLGIVMLAIIFVASPAVAGLTAEPAGGPGQSQFDSWVASSLGTHDIFNNLPQAMPPGQPYSSYLSSLPGVTFQGTWSPYGGPGSYPVIVDYWNGNPVNNEIDIVGAPCYGCVDDGRTIYEMTFSSPQRWAGVVRHWDTRYGVTDFYNGNNLLAEFKPNGSGPNWGTFFIGYEADTNMSDWVTSIVISGISNGDPTYPYPQVGYTRDLYFGTAIPTAGVPEPTTMLLLGLGLVGLAGVRRKF